MSGRTLMIVAFLLLAGAPAQLHAVDREQREFVIYVDGKESGQSTMVITQQDDGVCYMNATVNVKFQQLVLSYSLNVDAGEWWRDGKLVGLKCSATENGKKTDVVISAANNQLRVRVNGTDKVLRPETWTTSFWKLPDPKFHNKALLVFEVDTGKEFQGQLQYIATEQITYLNKPQSCYHFRVTGGPSPVDLWFDQYHRLVRQEFVELGRKTIVQLVNVRR